MAAVAPRCVSSFDHQIGGRLAPVQGRRRAALQGQEARMSVSLAGSRVLIVDDNEFNRKSLALVIRRSGLTELAFAADGLEGLEQVERFRPDLVLLDVDMPRLDGLEMCRRLRASADHAELPILFQTALDSDEEQVACFEAGGSDFISKPIKPGEVVARVRHHLERRRLFCDLASFRARVETELRHARAMQLSLLPEPKLTADLGRRYGLSLRSAFETSSELGGDLWSVIEIDHERLGLLIVDFAGHGITAAINTFRLHTLIERGSAGAAQPGEPEAWLGALNRALCDVLPTGQFATAFYAVIDVAHDQLTYVGAGSPHPVLVHGGELRLLDATGFVLGIAPKATYQAHTVPFGPGDGLFLYSDALVEGEVAPGQVLGSRGLLPALAEALARQPQDPVAALLGHTLAQAPRPMRDDLTLVWVERFTSLPAPKMLAL